MGFTTSLAVCVILSMFWDLKVESLEERHSLHYVYTALSKAVSAPGIFEFTAMGLLDDKKIDYYNSRDKVKIPEQDWMKEKLPAEYWNQGTQSRKSKEQWFKVNVNILMDRMRQNNSDIHVLMWRHGCDVITMPDGSLKFVKGVDEYSYDGMDFLSFDEVSTQWVAPVNAAVATKQKWDGVPTLNQYTKGYLETECVRWLGDFRRYRDEKEKQTDLATIHLFAKDAQSSDTYKLTCMATGLYSKNTEISILKGGWSVKKSCKEPKNILPNDDGTYQIRLSVDAKKSEIDDYGCEVNQGDQKTSLEAKWPKDGILSAAAPSSIGQFVPVVLVVLGLVVVLVIVIVGAICVKRGIIVYNGGLRFSRPNSEKDIHGNGNATSANRSGGENERGSSLPGPTETSVEIKPLLEDVQVAVKENADSDCGDSGKGGSTGSTQESTQDGSPSSSNAEMNMKKDGDSNSDDSGKGPSPDSSKESTPDVSPSGSNAEMNSVASGMPSDKPV